MRDVAFVEAILPLAFSIGSELFTTVRAGKILMNDVEVVLTVRCYNLDVPYLEASIHSFFSNVNVYFEMRDDNGIMHYPKEWFTVPLNIIYEAIPLIVDKKIDSYRYDKNLQMIIQKGTSEKDMGVIYG